MREARSTLALGVLLFALLLAALGSQADWAADEHLYLAGGQVMKEGGSLLVPAYHTGEPRFMKPPLFYWLVWVSMAALGTGFGSARLPALLSAMVVLYFTWRLASEGGRRPRDGAMAAAALGGSYLFLYHARAAVTDMTMTAGIAAGLCFLVEHMQARRGVAGLYLAAASLGLACMAKGPVALVLAAGAVALFFLLPGRPSLPNMRPSVHWLGALATLAAVGFWWYAAMWAAQGPAFLRHQLDAEVVGRTQSSIAVRAGNLCWYALRAFSAGLPLTLAAVWGAASGARPPSSASRRLAWCVVLATVVFYGLAINWRASRYLVPLTPFLAVIVGGCLAAGGDGGEKGGAIKALRLLTAALAGLGAAILLLVLAAVREDVPALRASVLAAAAVLAAGLSLALVRGWMPSLRAALVSSAALAYLFTVPNLLVKGIFRSEPMLAIAQATFRFAPGERVSDQGLTNRESALLYVFSRRGAVRLGREPAQKDLLVVKDGKVADPFQVRGFFLGPVRREAPSCVAGGLAGFLARGDLLRHLPRSGYYLVQRLPQDTAPEVEDRLGTGTGGAVDAQPRRGADP